MLHRFKVAKFILFWLLTLTVFLLVFYQMNIVHATYGFITVRYIDGTPRPGAAVQTYDGNNYFGVTDGNGQVHYDLPDGGYDICAYYPPGNQTPFGPGDTALIVPGNVTITAFYEITPPNITIISPQNRYYTNTSVPLTYTLNDFSPISWTGYSLDGHANATIVGNSTLTGLSFASHSIIVYLNDTFGNMGSSGTVYFSVQNNGVVTIRVQYLDGSPRNNADAKTIVAPNDPQERYICTTTENGQGSRSGYLESGDYQVQAYYAGTQFGPNTYLYVDSNGNGSATITADYEITPPNITILSPQNQTYTNSTVSSTYTLSDFSSISWTGYSLDGQTNITMAGNTTLIDLPIGSHILVIFSNDTFGNMGSSGTVHFTASYHVTIIVQYSDGAPRSGADVFIINGNQLGTTDSNGQINCDSLSPGGYNIWAFYRGSQFGPDTVLDTREGGITITANYEITPPTINILSPQNKTYQNNSVPLTFSVSDFSPISYMGYSLDGQANVTVAGNMTMSDLSLGSHTIIVWGNDTFGNMGPSSIANFTITIPGDINGDFKVSLVDLVLLANAYGSHSGDTKWNPNAEINGNGVVDLIDLVILANHYGQHYP